MFTDSRSKKVIFVAHCLLNQNSISDGTADFPSQFSEIINLLTSNQIGLIQLPCPEFACLGLDRQDRQGGKRPLLIENTRIRGLMSEKDHVKLLQVKAKEVIAQIQDYKSYGFKVLGIIGINRSPSCGVETTTRNNEEVKGQGVFIEQISEICQRRGLSVKMIGVKTSEKGEAVKRVQQLIKVADQM